MGKNLVGYDDRLGNDVQIIGGELRTGNMIAGGAEQEIYEQSATQNYVLGTKKIINGGERVFVYGHVKSTAAAPRGRCVLAYNKGNTEKGTKLGALTNGSFVIPWTCVGTIVANQYAEGHILMQGGFVKRIRSHPAGAPAGVINLTCYEPHTDITLVAGRYGMLVENKYADVYTKSESGDWPGLVVGVSIMDVTANYYAWFQVKGPCGILSSQSAKGELNNEKEIVHGANPGSEVIVRAAHGYQTVGYLLPMSADSWDNENFMLIDLCIE